MALRNAASLLGQRLAVAGLGELGSIGKTAGGEALK